MRLLYSRALLICRPMRANHCLPPEERDATALAQAERQRKRIAVRAVDARTLEVQLENPTPYFIDLCAFTVFEPVPKRVVEEHGTAWIKPGVLIGNGSYTLEDWRVLFRLGRKAGGR